MKKFLLFIIFSTIAVCGFSQERLSMSGKVIADDTRSPLQGAVVTMAENGLWAVTDEKGEFSIKNIQSGEYNVQVTYLGYVNYNVRMVVNRQLSGLKFSLKPDNLTIDNVVVTAKEITSGMSTVRTINKTAIDHMQVVNVSDIGSLLPGGRTVNPDLFGDNAGIFSLRSGDSSAGNNAFGTAVEVDGVRLSNNASFGDLNGVSTKNVATSNIESVEVVTGIPSVEYGDVTSGIVKIRTQSGVTPYTATFTTNPNTKQFSLAKGFRLGTKGGSLNASVERTQATNNPVSPYKSYTRNGLTLRYNTTFGRTSGMPLNFSVGLSGNLGGMNSKDDPDAMKGEIEKQQNNSVRFNTEMRWLLNRSWITNIEFKASANYADNNYSYKKPNTSSSNMPAVHGTDTGYYLADTLPKSYFSTQIDDSREVDLKATLKATWSRRFGKVMNSIKLGGDYTSSGNVGKGTYYADPATAPNGYRPRPYSDIPFMHNVALYIEDNVKIPIGSMSLEVMAGVRAEKTFIRDMEYKKAQSLSPRFNAKYNIIDKRRSKGFHHLSFRGGWGVTEKLPSFNILYPTPSYRDISVYSQSAGNGFPINIYYTMPATMQYNPALRWMRNQNIEAGVQMSIGDTDISFTGFYNKTKYPYRLSSQYVNYQYNIFSAPTGFKMPNQAGVRIDQLAGMGSVFIYDATDPSAGETKLGSMTDQTFVPVTRQENGSPVLRRGIEMTIDFGEIKSIRTNFKLDASYTNVIQHEDGMDNLYFYYPSSQRHSLAATNPAYAKRSYEYMGIYPMTISSSSTNNYRSTNVLNANLTVVTHIPKARMIISLRLEGVLIDSYQNKSLFMGKEWAYKTASQSDKTVTPGSIYDRDSYSAIWPLYYMDLNGSIFNFTATEAAKPEFQQLIRSGGSPYTYNKGGYYPYFFANLSITKEIGDLASISFYANNASNVRKYIEDKATYLNVIPPTLPTLYYGLTLRLKF
jgi:hypothetical protein